MPLTFILKASCVWNCSTSLKMLFLCLLGCAFFWEEVILLIYSYHWESLLAAFEISFIFGFLGIFVSVHSALSSLSFFYLWIDICHQIGKVSAMICFMLYYLFSFWDLTTCKLEYFNFSHRLWGCSFFKSVFYLAVLHFG